MKLRLSLMLLCLFCIGMFAKSQDKKKVSAKPTVENGPDPIPVTVTSNKKAHPKPPPPPLPPPPKAAKTDTKSLPTPPPPPVPPKVAKDAPKSPPLTPSKPNKSIPILQKDDQS